MKLGFAKNAVPMKMTSIPCNFNVSPVISVSNYIINRVVNFVFTVT
jgi:hypothetical protein